MANATGSRHGVRYVPEVTWGTTPGTPTMVSLRNNGCSLAVQKSTLSSNEIRSDRQIVDLRHGAAQVGGTIDFEFSYGEFDALLEGALFGAWTSDVLKGGATSKSFTIERAFLDVAQYGAFAGCMVNGFSLSVQRNAIVTGSFDILGKTATYSGTPLKASPTASQTNLPYDTFSGTMSEGGSSIAYVTGVDFSVANNLEPQFFVGAGTSASSVTVGRINVSGTLSAAFTNATLLNKFLNETESSLSLTLGNGTTKSYTILIPRIKYTGGDNPVSGEGEVVLSMPFQALYDSVTGTNIQITRILGS